MMNDGIQIGVSESGPVRVSLRILNRHGLIAGATGTGKTKTMQSLIEQLSAAGVAVFAPDMKGDLSGLAARDSEAQFPVQFWSLTGVNGTQIRTSVASFGPVLMGKVLGLNDTQSSVLALAFAFASDKGFKLDTLADLAHVVKKLGAKDEYVSKATVGVLLREITLLSQAGGNELFDVSNFKVTDLLDGNGTINLLSLQDVQDRPQIFSTFMLWLLTQLHKTLPEIGDVAQPKLVFFFDEAHLLFADAPKLLVEQLERTVRLIRSKGVGVFFVTQAATDLPSTILGQLGNRVQHALRAFTPDDEKVIKATARTFPRTTEFDVQDTITNLAIGQAIVSVLSDTGIPSEPKIVKIRRPQSRLGALASHEFPRHQPKLTLVKNATVRENVASVHEVQAEDIIEDTAAEEAAPQGAGSILSRFTFGRLVQSLGILAVAAVIFVVSMVGRALLGRSAEAGFRLDV